MHGFIKKFFFTIVKKAWSTNINGTPMFIVAKELKLVKQALMEWQKQRPPVNLKIKEACLHLEQSQPRLQANPTDGNLLQ